MVSFPMRVVALILVLMLLAATASAGAILTGLPDVTLLKSHHPLVRLLPVARPRAGAQPGHRRQRFEVRLMRSRPAGWVSLAEISRGALAAIIVSEDGNFYSHAGYDLAEIRRAIRQDLEHGQFKRGASTITQQVAKNVYLNAEKSIWRKIKELAIALRMEDELTKSRILEIYVNIVEWGPGVFGIGAAARYYFEKHPSELNAKEGAFLAMLLPSPIRYGQSFRDKHLTRYATRTIRRLLEKLVITGRVSPQEFDEYMSEPLSFERAALEEGTGDETAPDDEDLPEEEPAEPEPERDEESESEPGSESSSVTHSAVRFSRS
ncbi:MAG: transglycosylase domain-containing protein [Bdellovibrionales bacterium]|nr:transglycosylase domain-containing protein [Bdellovibrionales bacterium]